MVSEKVMDFFPHHTVRSGQSELIVDLEQTLTEGKTLLAHAPTGLGKTASALSVAVKHAIEKGKKIFFLTNRHTQHQIAVNTLNLIKEKTGKEIQERTKNRIGYSSSKIPFTNCSKSLNEKGFLKKGISPKSSRSS